MSKVLGINARNLLYIKPSLTKRVARILDNKILTKKTLAKVGIPVPKTFAAISSTKELSEFVGEDLPSSFALKPNRGLGGEGILIIFGRKKENSQNIPAIGISDPVSSRIMRIFSKQTHEPTWVKADGNAVTLSDIKNHILNILDGTFSLGNFPDTAFFEERIKILKLFKNYSYK